MPSRRILTVARSLVVLGAVLSALPAAAAQPIVLKRSAENLSMAPLDAVVSPYTAWETLDRNLAPVESTGGKVATGIIGYPYYLGTYLVLAGFRFAAGIAELPIGAVLWPVNAFHRVEVGPFFDTSEAGALVDKHTEVMDFKFGGRWLTAR
jgi:hypothetical protein